MPSYAWFALLDHCGIEQWIPVTDKASTISLRRKFEFSTSAGSLSFMFLKTVIVLARFGLSAGT